MNKKYVIIYWSRYGNGKKVVENLATKLNKKGASTQIFRTNELDPGKLPEADRYVFSTPTEAFNIQKNMRKFMKKLQCMDGKECGVINTHAMNRNWLKKMEKLLTKKKMVVIAELDFKVDGEVDTGNGLPNGWEKKLELFANKI
jgi:flavodoxin